MKEIEEMGIHLISPAEYLEKVFQVPFELPEPEPEDLGGIVTSLLTNLVEEKVQEVAQGKANDEERKKSTTANSQSSNNRKKRRSRASGTTFSNATPANLKLSPEEPELLQQMLVVVGNTPRTVKRFVNIYHFIRSHAKVRVTAETASDNYLIMMFLLALRIGEHWPHSGLFFNEFKKQNQTVRESLRQVKGLMEAKLIEKLEKSEVSQVLELSASALLFPEIMALIRRFSFSEDYESEEIRTPPKPAPPLISPGAQ